MTKKLRQYTVTWSYDCCVESPEEAAALASAVMLTNGEPANGGDGLHGGHTLVVVECEDGTSCDVDLAKLARAREESEATSYRPMFLISGQWDGNGQRFATREEAEASAQARFAVWITIECADGTMPTAHRADPSDEPVTHKRVGGRDEHVSEDEVTS